LTQFRTNITRDNSDPIWRSAIAFLYLLFTIF